MSKIDQIIDEVIKVEGGYVNDPRDSGGETNFGITVAVARANGYTGAMKDMPIQFARDLYKKRYVVEPGFDKILAISEAVAAELVDTGVNMGPGIASKFLQRALNGLNCNGKFYPDSLVDGKIGNKTVENFSAYMAKRGKEGEAVMLKALNCLQGTRYLEIAEGNSKNEDFVFGWISNRIKL